MIQEHGDLVPYVHLQDLEGQNTKAESYSCIIWRTSKRAFKTLICFTYSAQLPWFFIAAGRLPHKSGNSDESLEIATIIGNVLDMAIIIPATVSFATMLVGGKLYGQMIAAESAHSPNAKTYQKDIERIIKNSIVVSIPFILITGSAIIFLKFGQEEEIAEATQQFLREASIFIPLCTVRFILQQILLIFEKTKKMIAISLFSFIFGDLILADILGYGLPAFGWPAKGLQGIYWGMFTENVLCVVGVGLCLYQDEFKDYQFSKSFLSWNRLDYNQIIQILKQSLPIQLAYFSELGTNLFKTTLADRLGTVPLAVQDFSGQIVFLLLFFAHSIAQTVSLNISGTQDENHQSQIARGGVITSLIAGTFICLPLIIWPQILTIFGDVSPEVMAAAITPIRLSASSSICYTVSLTMLQSRRTKPGHVKSTLVFNGWLWASTLLSYGLAFPLKLGINGINWGAFFGNLMGTLHLLKHFLQAFPKPQSTSLPTQEDPIPQASSSWYSLFTPTIRRCQTWWYGTPSSPQSTL